LGKAAELRYGRLSQIEKDIQAREQEMEAVKENALLKEEIGEDDIARIVAKWTGIPVARMMEGEIQKLVHMPERLKDRVVGQDEAVRLVANAILRNRAGMGDPNRPIGSFIFLGPTGVGKTELVRALAEDLFDDEKAMIRVDMSEYMEKHAVAAWSARRRDTWVSKRAASLPSRCAAGPTRWCCWMKSKRPIPTSSICCSRFWTTDDSLTARAAPSASKRVVVMTSNVGTGMMEKNSLGFSVHGKDSRTDDTPPPLLEELRKQFRPSF